MLKDNVVLFDGLDSLKSEQSQNMLQKSSPFMKINEKSIFALYNCYRRNKPTKYTKNENDYR